MSRRTRVAHEFVEFIPDELCDGTIYISVEFGTASHLCCCGCGRKVVTPITPTDWRVIFDGETVSLDPSIGNWDLPCKSHYWIARNKVRWAESWEKLRIDAARAEDRELKKRYFDDTQKESVEEEADESLWSLLFERVFGNRSRDSKY